MNFHILDSAVQQFINEHLNDDIPPIILKKSPFVNVSSKELAEQIESKKRSEKKLPLWYNTRNIYYPQKLSIEQSSSELTAAYKSSLAYGNRLIDLTGGFGVDSYYFSKKVTEIVCCELNTELSEISRHNAAILGANNIEFISTDSLDYLHHTSEPYHTIFVDPSRRIKSNKVFMLKDCKPDVSANIDFLTSKADRIIIKTSPLLDIQAGLKELKHVSMIHIVSVKNDCKELLWIIDKNFEGETEIRCAALSEPEEQIFSFKLSEERSVSIESYAVPEKYIYEPDAALLKSGCFKLITQRFTIKKLHPNSQLYTSSKLVTNFIGRTFSIIHLWEYKDFMKNNTIKKANIITRNFPLSPEKLKKNNKIEDGGNDYLLFTTGPSNQLIVIHAKRL